MLIGLIFKVQTCHFTIKSIPALFKQADKADYMMNNLLFLAFHFQFVSRSLIKPVPLSH